MWASIVRSHLKEQPVVVVSAMGKTTDRLLEIADLAARRDDQLLGKQLEELQNFHLQAAERLLDGNALETLEAALRQKFFQLRLTLTDVSRHASGLTFAIKDEIVSYGEQLPSQVVAVAFAARGIESIHFDAAGIRDGPR